MGVGLSCVSIDEDPGTAMRNICAGCWRVAVGLLHFLGHISVPVGG